MANYINLATNQLCTESEIRAAHPNTSFATPFSPDGYAVVHWAGQPDYDKYTQTIQLGAPVEALPNHWEQTWSIIQLTGDQLTDAQAQKVEDEKAKIKADIATLEATITPRRTREAILAIDITWLADIELQIGQLRQQLMEVSNARR
jgi:hypothetical protein